MILVRNLLAEATILLYRNKKRTSRKKVWRNGPQPALGRRKGVGHLRRGDIRCSGRRGCLPNKKGRRFPSSPFLCILRSALRAGDVCQIDLEAWAHGRADRHAADIFAL